MVGHMQMFLIPKGITSKIDKLLRNFLWGYDTEKTHHLHLKAWGDVTLPKEKGGLGIRRIREMNQTMITKLNWQVCTEDHKVWVQLVRAQYLRGRRRLDFEHTHKTCSWIWGGITQCVNLLKRGLCFQVGKQSKLIIGTNSWLLSLTNFKIPLDTQLPGIASW